MKITFLGQNGFLIESKKSIFVIDPYLSDAVEKIEPQNKRRQPIDERYLRIKPDAVIITHSHADHYDEETLDELLNGVDGVTFFAPPSVFAKAKKRYPDCNAVYFESGTSYTAQGAEFIAVKAEHSDPEAIGIIIKCEGKTLYFTGDTLYSEKVFDSLPEIKIDGVFLPINGRGNNMNAVDAARFAERVNAKFVIPTHFGMFDDMTGKELVCDKVVIPEIYKEIKLK